MFDYPDENFFDAPERRVQNTIMMAKAGGEPMQSAFSYSKLEKLLEKHGFLIYELLTPDDIQRDIIDKAGVDLKAFEHVNDCLAVRRYESERWQKCQKREDFLFDSMKENMNLTEWPGRDVFSDGLPVMGCIRAGEIIPAAQKSPIEMHPAGRNNPCGTKEPDRDAFSRAK